MKQINYYIISTIAATMGLAIVGLVGILSVFSLLDQIEDLRNNYTIFAAMLFVLNDDGTVEFLSHCVHSIPVLIQ